MRERCSARASRRRSVQGAAARGSSTPRAGAGLGAAIRHKSVGPEGPPTTA
ncbi:DUF6053 domain-containing protein [Lysobacter enzymogenes]|uniref:DUF6053 domain-containing protein n=1 Tax=Lysobacter enzymogenes TaxID=69 RepID=UPI003D18A1F3